MSLKLAGKVSPLAYLSRRFILSDIILIFVNRLRAGTVVLDSCMVGAGHPENMALLPHDPDILVSINIQCVGLRTHVRPRFL